MYISLKDMSMWKLFVVSRSTPSHFYANLQNFQQKNTSDKDIAAKKDVNGEVSGRTTIKTSTSKSTPPTNE